MCQQEQVCLCLSARVETTKKFSAQKQLANMYFSKLQICICPNCKYVFVQIVKCIYFWLCWDNKTKYLSKLQMCICSNSKMYLSKLQRYIFWIANMYLSKLQNIFAFLAVFRGGKVLPPAKYVFVFSAKLSKKVFQPAGLKQLQICNGPNCENVFVQISNIYLSKLRKCICPNCTYMQWST